MEDNEQLKIQQIIEQIDKQHDRLDVLSSEQQNMKRNLVLFKFVKVFKERNDIYCVGVTLTKDSEEAEMLSGEKMNPKNTHFGSFLVVGIILPTVLHYSLVENKFNINLSVHFDKKRICRQVVVTKGHTFVVIPWSVFPVNSELNISLFGKVNDKKLIFRIPTIVLNISYFIRPLDYVKCDYEYGKYKQHLLEISRLYRVPKKCFYDDYKTTYTMIVPNEVELLNVVLKDCLQHLKKFKKTDDYKFEVLRDTSMTSQVNLIKNRDYLEIQSDIRNLYEMKKHLINELYYNDIKEKQALKKFAAAAFEEFQKEPTVEYHFLRKLWQI